MVGEIEGEGGSASEPLDCNAVARGLGGAGVDAMDWFSMEVGPGVEESSRSFSPLVRARIGEG